MSREQDNKVKIKKELGNIDFSRDQGKCCPRDIFQGYL